MKSSVTKVWKPIVLGLLVVASCKSADELREEADEEVYDILEARRAELGATDPFDIEPPADSLRARLLAGERELPPLDLVDCLDIAAENSRAYRDRREALYLTALDLTRERWEFSWQETAGGEAAVFGDLDGLTDAEVEVGNRTAGSVVDQGDIGISKVFASGAQFLADISLQWTRDFNGNGSTDSFGRFGLSVTQPLLRGFGSDIVLEPLTQAERNVLYEARSYERFRRTFAFDVASRYYRILAQRDTLANERANYTSLVDLRKRNEALAEAGRLSDIQVDQALQNELRAQDTVVAVQSSLESLLDDFKLFLGLPIDAPVGLAEGDVDELGLLDLVEVTEQGLDDLRAIEVAQIERLDYHTSVDRVSDAERALVIAEDDLRASLDVGGSFNGTSRADDPFTFASNGANWSVGIGLDLPIDQLPERNLFRAAEIALESRKRGAEEFFDAMYADLRRALRDVAEQRDRLEIQRNAVVLARRRVESTQLSQEAGRADTRDVLEAQESLIQAENQATQAETDYLLAGLALFRDMGLIRVDGAGVSVSTDGLTVP